MSGSEITDFDREFAEFLSPFLTEHRLRRFDEVLDQRTRHLTVMLEDVYQSHNASACLRSCDCFGIQDVHIVEKTNQYEVNRDVALGSAQWLTLHQHRDTQNNTLACIDHLRQGGYRIVATSPHGDGVDLEGLDITRKTALMFGTETDGLTPEALDRADELLLIPMFGFTESFNISVALALCLYRLTWRMRHADIDWHLSDAEQAALRVEWVKCAIGHRLEQFEADFRKRRAAGDR